MKRIILTFIIILAVLGGSFLAYTALMSDDDTKQVASNEENATKQDTSQEQLATEPQAFNFTQTKKAAHYVSNTPAHEAVLSSAPNEVSIVFDFDLTSKSTIQLTKDGQDVGTGTASVSNDQLTLTRPISENAGSGLYTVQYNACWPDGSCHDGQFQFGVQ